MQDMGCRKRITCPEISIIRDITEAGLTTLLPIAEARCQSKFRLSGRFAKQLGVPIQSARQHRSALMINMRTQWVEPIRGGNSKGREFRHDMKGGMARTWRATLP